MKNRSNGVKAKPRRRRDPLITHTLRIILISSILCVDFILDNKQKAKEHKRAILLISRGAPSIRETSLIGSSLLAKTSIKHSLTPSVPTPSSGFNEEIFSVLMSPFIRNWCVSSLLPLSLMPLLIGWRIGPYSKGQSRENATLSRLRDCNTVKESRLLIEFWPTIRDGGFNVGNANVASIRDSRVFKNSPSLLARPLRGERKPLIESPRLTSTISFVSTLPRSLATFLQVDSLTLRIGLSWNYKVGCVLGPLYEQWRRKKMRMMMRCMRKLEGGSGSPPIEEARGSTAMYRNMIQGDWQVRQACGWISKMSNGKAQHLDGAAG
ncbi:hypothetical protein Tco_0308428 [Tanacetum coccineum]